MQYRENQYHAQYHAIQRERENQYHVITNNIVHDIDSLCIEDDYMFIVPDWLK